MAHTDQFIFPHSPFRFNSNFNQKKTDSILYNKKYVLLDVCLFNGNERYSKCLMLLFLLLLLTTSKCTIQIDVRRNYVQNESC